LTSWLSFIFHFIFGFLAFQHLLDAAAAAGAAIAAAAVAARSGLCF